MSNIKSDILEEILKKAIVIAKKYSCEYVHPEHVLYALIQDQLVYNILLKLEINMMNIENDLVTLLSNSKFYRKVENTNPKQSKLLETLLYFTYFQTICLENEDEISMNLLYSLFFIENSYACYILNKNKLAKNHIVSFLSESRNMKNIFTLLDQKIGTGNDTSVLLNHSNNSPFASTIYEKYITKKNVNLLDNLSIEMVALAKDGKYERLVGRELEVHEIEKNLLRKNKSNIILTGHPGIGKTKVVEGLAKKIAESKDGYPFKDYKIYSLDVSSIVAGTRFRGDFEERMKLIIEELKNRPKSILFIDEIHLIIGSGAGSDSQMDVANILKPALSRGDIKVIGATTNEEFRKTIEKDKALSRRFKKLEVKEPTKEQTYLILNGILQDYNTFYGVNIQSDVVKDIVDLSVKYIHNKFLPDKAIDILDLACAEKKLASYAGDVDKKITLKDIYNQVSKYCNIPEIIVEEEEEKKLSELEVELKKSIFGQDNAIEKIVNSILVSKSGLRESNKTQGVFLFRGGSGTGKTEICRKLSSVMGIPLIKFDMSEYSEEHSTAKLIGSPPGYKGYEDGGAGSGILINKIEENPYCILLLDEIEKAHRSIHNLFLQAMDDGKITSSDGKEVSFTNVIMIMTSNVGAEDEMKQIIGFNKDNSLDKGEKALKDTFLPEFRNRLDAIVRFNNLNKDILEKIFEKNIEELNILCKSKNVNVIIDKNSVDWFLEKALKENLGARPLKKLITEYIKEPLSKEILFGSFKNNGGSATAKVQEDRPVLIIN